MSAWAWVILGFAFAAGVQVFGAAKQKMPRALCKGLACACAAALRIMCGAAGARGWIAAGLVLCLCGDMAINDRPAVGGVFFFAAHLLFGTGFLMIGGFAPWQALAFALLAAAAVPALRASGVPREWRAGVCLYGLALGGMVCLSFGAGGRFAAGAALFAVSDLWMALGVKRGVRVGDEAPSRRAWLCVQTALYTGALMLLAAG